MASEPFQRVPRLARGYDRGQVEDFLDRAKRVWDAGGPPGQVTAWHIRTVGFDLRRGGYEVAAVDSALDRIEDAFAAREARAGAVDLSDAEAKVTARLRRQPGDRFPRAQGLSLGYRPGDVDALLQLVRAHLLDGQVLAVDDVRGAVFRGVRGKAGYREAPVDAYLDRVVDVMRSRAAARGRAPGPR